MKKIILICVFIASMSTGYTQGGCDDCFVTTWDTRLDLAHPNNSVIKSPVQSGAHDIDINNDGTFELINHPEKGIIDFGSPGIHTIAIRPNVANTKKELRLSVAGRTHTSSGQIDNELLLTRIDKWGSIVWTSMQVAFSGCRNLTTIADDAGVPNLTKVACMSSMFSVCHTFNADLSKWDVSNVTSMRAVFSRNFNFTSDLSSWDVSKVIDMQGTFRNASSFTSDLGSWNVSQVTNVRYMFINATSFTPEHYDALLIGWASLPTLYRPNFLRAPPTTYCAGKQARETLRSRGWIITGDNGEDCSPVTSVDEEFLSNTKIYPNPTRGKISIESPFTIEKLELYNILGAKLFSVSKTNVLDLTSLRQGIYILKAFSTDRVISKKIIKN